MRWLIAIVVLAAIALVGEHFLSGAGKDKITVSATQVSAATAVRRDVPLNVSLAGNVVAYETVAIKSRIDSQIVDVPFKDGDTVEQGQVLFVLDDRSLKAQIRQLEASVQKEQATLENVRLQYERARQLITTKAVSQSHVDDTKAAFIGQQALVNATQASLENTRVLLSYCTITAPISGRAGTINVTRGNNVRAGDTEALVTINRVSPIRAQFSIPERYYEQVKLAMSSAVSVAAEREGSGQIAGGTLEYIDNTIDASTGSFAARAVFANEQEALWPGMFVKLTLELGHDRAALTIPAVAVQGDTGKHFVFRLEGGKAIKTPVEVVRNTGELAVIAAGLQDGQQVAIDGILRLADGVAVEIVSPKGQTEEIVYKP